jgi:hypothetical protein
VYQKDYKRSSTIKAEEVLRVIIDYFHPLVIVLVLIIDFETKLDITLVFMFPK